MERPRIVVLGGINMDLVATVERFPVPGETVVGRGVHDVFGAVRGRIKRWRLRDWGHKCEWWGGWEMTRLVISLGMDWL